MEGPVLSGGVIVLVAALLWLLYLLPSWRGRAQFHAAERNAVRLNQALRVLAETSETPEEVRVELRARSALAQQKLAKRVQAEKEAAELELLRAELAATRADPVVRQARARRRVRVLAFTILLAGLAVTGLGIWQLVTMGAALWAWVGGAVAVVGLWMLQRMAAVSARAARAAQREASAPQETRARPATRLHDQGRPQWTPRQLPEPLVSVEGTRAHAAQARMEAQRERRAAAHAEELRRRAEQMAPPAPVPIPAAAAPVAPSAFASMGYVDDAEIEAHVRQLLARRATG